MRTRTAASSACSGALRTLSVLLRREKLDKERLKALGMGAFASYGVISNLNYGTALT
jgi:hypothetical protein